MKEKNNITSGDDDMIIRENDEYSPLADLVAIRIVPLEVGKEFRILAVTFTREDEGLFHGSSDGRTLR